MVTPTEKRLVWLILDLFWEMHPQSLIDWLRTRDLTRLDIYED